jgi:hypothetical protein
MHPDKTKAIDEWPTPTTLRETQSFMQFCNFYREFIPDFAAITRPFNELTKKDRPFVWEGPQQRAFELLKAWVRDNVVLTIPVDGAPFRLKTDASDLLAGAVLHQLIDGRSFTN